MLCNSGLSGRRYVRGLLLSLMTIPCIFYQLDTPARVFADWTIDVALINCKRTGGRVDMAQGEYHSLTLVQWFQDLSSMKVPMPSSS